MIQLSTKNETIKKMPKQKQRLQTIPIDENSRMFIEDNNYTLQYRRTGIDPKTGKMGKGDMWVLGGYFPTMDTLLQDWVINAPAHAKQPPESLKEVCQIIKDAEKLITNLLK